MDYTKLILQNDKSYALKHSIFNSSTNIFPHAHNCYELIHFVHFSGCYSVEGQIYEINNNDMLITNPNELHKALLPPNTLFENQQFLLKEAFLAEFVFDNYNPFRALKYRELGCHNKIDGSIVTQYHLDDLFAQISYYHKNTLPESQAMIKALALQLLTHVNNIVTITPTKKENHNVIQDILIYINKYLTEKITLELLGDKFSTSKYYISRLFKQQTGYTVIEYITAKRILLAKELMLNGMYASDAALEAGFLDYSNFYKSFKHTTGMSPLSFQVTTKKESRRLEHTIMNEQDYEKLLNIKTSGEQKIFNESSHYNRYEPTAYFVLEILSKQYQFTAEDHIIDFGCGKGRLNFYLSHFFAATTTGIEMNPFYYQQALDNKRDYLKKHKPKRNNIDFLHCFAEEYHIHSFDNKFYFFNPFSLQIFIKVIGNILLSVEKSERTVDIILFYPSYDYIYFIENTTPFVLLQEIKVPSLHDHDPRHNFLVYRLDTL